MTKLKTIAQRLLQVSRNRNIAIFACVLLIALASWAAYQDAQPATRPLASCMPAGAMLYIESPDLAPCCTIGIRRRKASMVAKR